MRPGMEWPVTCPLASNLLFGSRLMNRHPSNREPRRCKAMTLVEMIVGVGVGSLVLMSVMAVYLTSSRSFAGMGNYVVMEQSSRSALDQMTRDIRRSKNL